MLTNWPSKLEEKNWSLIWRWYVNCQVQRLSVPGDRDVKWNDIKKFIFFSNAYDCFWTLGLWNLMTGIWEVFVGSVFQSVTRVNDRQTQCPLNLRQMYLNWDHITVGWYSQHATKSAHHRYEIFLCQSDLIQFLLVVWFFFFAQPQSKKARILHFWHFCDFIINISIFWSFTM